MPREGSHRPDDYSPYKLSDGRVLKILKSTNSKTLYFKIVENHEGKFYPKISVKTAEGKTKYKMIGKGWQCIPSVRLLARLAAAAAARALACVPTGTTRWQSTQRNACFRRCHSATRSATAEAARAAALMATEAATVAAAHCAMHLWQG